MAVDANDTIHTASIDGNDNAIYNQFSASISSGTVTGLAQDITDEATGSPAWAVSIALDSTGTPFVTVVDTESGTAATYFHLNLYERTGAGSWTGHGYFATGDTSHINPSTEVDGNDDVHIAWQKYSTEAMWTKFDTSDGSYLSNESIRLNTSESVGSVSLMVDPADDEPIVTYDNDGVLSGGAIEKRDAGSWSGSTFSANRVKDSSPAMGPSKLYVVFEDGGDIYENHAETASGFADSGKTAIESSADTEIAPTARWQFYDENDPAHDKIDLLYYNDTAADLMYSSFETDVAVSQTVTEATGVDHPMDRIVDATRTFLGLGGGVKSVAAEVPGKSTLNTSAADSASHARQIVRDSALNIIALAHKTNDEIEPNISTDDGQNFTDGDTFIAGDSGASMCAAIDSTDELRITSRNPSDSTQIIYNSFTIAEDGTVTQNVVDETVYDNGSNDVSQSFVAVNSSDTAYCVVTEFNASSSTDDLRLLRRDGADTWADLGVVVSDSANTRHPSVAVDDNDDLHIAYGRDASDAVGSSHEMWYDKWDTSAGSFAVSNEEITNLGVMPRASTAVNSSNNPIVTSNGDEHFVWKRSGGSWDSITYESDLDPTVNEASVGVDSSDVIWVIYSNGDGDILEAHDTFSNMGSGSGRVIITSANTLRYPSVHFQHYNRHYPSLTTADFIYHDETASDALYSSVNSRRVMPSTAASVDTHGNAWGSAFTSLVGTLAVRHKMQIIPLSDIVGVPETVAKSIANFVRAETVGVTETRDIGGSTLLSRAVGTLTSTSTTKTVGKVTQAVSEVCGVSTTLAKSIRNHVRAETVGMVETRNAGSTKPLNSPVGTFEVRTTAGAKPLSRTVGTATQIPLQETVGQPLATVCGVSATIARSATLSRLRSATAGAITTRASLVGRPLRRTVGTLDTRGRLALDKLLDRTIGTTDTQGLGRFQSLSSVIGAIDRLTPGVHKPLSAVHGVIDTRGRLGPHKTLDATLGTFDTRGRLGLDKLLSRPIAAITARRFTVEKSPFGVVAGTIDTLTPVTSKPLRDAVGTITATPRSTTTPLSHTVGAIDSVIGVVHKSVAETIGTAAATATVKTKGVITRTCSALARLQKN